MKKKIIIGLVITIVISLTSFGAIYAYQRENINLDGVNAQGYGINYSSNGNQAGECFRMTNGDDEFECPEYEMQFRYHNEEGENIDQMEAGRHEHQHMHENEYNEDYDQECLENERSFQNQNENTNKQNRSGNSK